MAKRKTKKAKTKRAKRAPTKQAAKLSARGLSAKGPDLDDLQGALGRLNTAVDEYDHASAKEGRLRADANELTEKANEAEEACAKEKAEMRAAWAHIAQLAVRAGVPIKGVK